MGKTSAVTRAVLVAGLAFGCHAPTWAHSVFKCTAGGRTTYQSTPCVNQGESMAVPSGPTAQQVQEAKARASGELSRASAAVAAAEQGPAAPGSPQFPQPLRQPTDCAGLGEARARAFGQRNAAVRDSRQTNIDQSSTVNKAQSDIQSIESRMRAGGCKRPD